MPLRNRVTPSGAIVATAHRGTLMGNRGVLHDDEGRLVREWRVRRWIACRLQFRGRHREVLQPRRWTELFFLDEATAIAAGHRPCAECRNSDYKRWQAAWAGGATSAGAMDDRLHADRLASFCPLRAVRALPVGAMVAFEGTPWLVTADGLRAWSFAGYGELRSAPRERVRVLTPAVAVATLAAGYEPGLHPTAA